MQSIKSAVNLTQGGRVKVDGYADFLILKKHTNNGFVSAGYNIFEMSHGENTENDCFNR